VRLDEIESAQPAETRADLLLHRDVSAPNVQLPIPQSVGESNLFEPVAVVLEGGSEWTEVESEGGHEPIRQ
jgi:hypothetical protein